MNNLGVLLAGGTGTRLFPLTKLINKHLLPIYDKPMIYYSLSILLMSKIRNIVLVCNSESLDKYQLLLGDGSELGVGIEYAIQDNPEGIPHAINTATQEKKYNKLLVVLGDNFIYSREFYKNILEKAIEESNVSVFSQKVKQPENFGVVELEQSTNKIIGLHEKPKNFVSSEAVIGIYHFDNKFNQLFNNQKKSARGEYEILDTIKAYGLENIKSYNIGRGTAWFDMGSFDDYFNTSLFVKTIQDRQGMFVNSPHEIAFRNEFITELDLENYIKKNTNSEYAQGLRYLLK
jgi:glucose-1-phosphate thymidylyltransferase